MLSINRETEIINDNLETINKRDSEARFRDSLSVCGRYDI